VDSWEEADKEWGFPNKFDVNSREKDSINDLAYNVVPAWSRYVVSATPISTNVKYSVTFVKGRGRTFELRVLSLSDCVHILRVSPSILQYFFFIVCDSHHIETFITPR
jgi:hypothetical protein